MTKQKKYFYQIKGIESSEIIGGDKSAKYRWKPLESGVVLGKNKLHARSRVEEDHPSLKFQKGSEMILVLTEIKKNGKFHHMSRERECLHCGVSYRLIDRYNDELDTNINNKFCSTSCQINHRPVFYSTWMGEEILRRGILDLPGFPATIYRIYNRDEDKSYVGCTVREVFNRWGQHFVKNEGVKKTKFHEALNTNPLTSWSFEILETVQFPPGTSDPKAIKSHVRSREKFWIQKLDSKHNGYNSTI